MKEHVSKIMPSFTEMLRKTSRTFKEKVWEQNSNVMRIVIDKVQAASGAVDRAFNGWLDGILPESGVVASSDVVENFA